MQDNQTAIPQGNNPIIPQGGTALPAGPKGTGQLKPMIEQKVSTDLLIGKDANKSGLVSNLSRLIRGTWETNRNAKRQIEERLLKDLRARKSEYDPQQLRNIRAKGGSEIYMGLTGIKCRGAKSWIRDILMPAGDKPWGLSPTPIPDLPPWAEEAIVRRIQETTGPEDSQADIVARLGKLRDLGLEAIRKDAKQRSKRMEDKIADQLAESNFEEQFLEFIDDFTSFPAAIIKGPMSYKRKKLKWGTYQDGFTPVTEDVVRIESKRVSPFDAYPSPMSKGINDGNFIEHIRLNRGELYALIGVSGYKEQEIRACLQEYSNGGLKEWLWNEYERSSLENKQYWWQAQSEKDIDAIHFWGSAQGKHLLEWGVPTKQVDDIDKEYQVDAIMIGTHVIRAVINNDPLGRRPYHKACFDPIPSAFWGNSLPELIEDKQRVCNAVARALVNNVAMASGPMVEVFSDRLAPDEQITVEPWRVYQTIRGEGASVGSNGNVRFFQPDIHASELIAVYEEFEKKADDASMIPKYAYGDANVGGAGSTARGLSMLMNSASKGIKTAIAQIDLNVMRPMIEQFFYYNMVNDPDQTIKGDSSIIARGANALLMKEQSHAERIEFLNMTNNPIDQQIVGVEARAELLRETVKSLDMPDLIPEADEFKARMAEQAEQASKQPDPEQVKLQGQKDIKNSELMAQAEENDKQRDFDAKENKANRVAQAAREAENRSSAKVMQKRLDVQKQEGVKVDNRETPDMKDKGVARLLEKFEALEKTVKETHQEPVMTVEPNHNIPMLPKVEPVAPINLHLTIDNKSGKVQKTIDVTKRSKEGPEQLKVIEEPA